MSAPSAPNPPHLAHPEGSARPAPPADPEHPEHPENTAPGPGAALPAPAARLALFRLGRRLCGVAAASCRQFVHLDAVTPVPLAPAPLLGVAQLRGRILPVIDAVPLLAPAPGNGDPAARPASAWPADRAGWTATPPTHPTAPPARSGEGGMAALVVSAGGHDSALAALRVTEIVGFEHPSPALTAGGPPRWRDEEVAVLDVAALVARLRPAAPLPGGPAWPQLEEVGQR